MRAYSMINLVVALPLFGAYFGAHQDLTTVQGGVEHPVCPFRRVFCRRNVKSSLSMALANA